MLVDLAENYYLEDATTDDDNELTGALLAIVTATATLVKNENTVEQITGVWMSTLLRKDVVKECGPL